MIENFSAQDAWLLEYQDKRYFDALSQCTDHIKENADLLLERLDAQTSFDVLPDIFHTSIGEWSAILHPAKFVSIDNDPPTYHYSAVIDVGKMCRLIIGPQGFVPYPPMNCILVGGENFQRPQNWKYVTHFNVMPKGGRALDMRFESMWLNMEDIKWYCIFFKLEDDQWNPVIRMDHYRKLKDNPDITPSLKKLLSMVDENKITIK